MRKFAEERMKRLMEDCRRLQGRVPHEDAERQHGVFTTLDEVRLLHPATCLYIRAEDGKGGRFVTTSELIHCYGPAFLPAVEIRRGEDVWKEARKIRKEWQ